MKGVCVPEEAEGTAVCVALLGDEHGERLVQPLQEDQLALLLSQGQIDTLNTHTYTHTQCKHR